MQKSTMWCVALAIVASGCGRGSDATAVPQGNTPGSPASSPRQEKGPPAEKEISFDLADDVKLEMVLIPAGEYRMGSPDSDQYALPREKPPHRVRITRPFYLGKYKVTQQQWQAVMDANPSHFKSPKNPVEWIRWSDCQAFLGKLDASHAKGKGRFALPTEAQWEYACRAGSTTRYCFGDDDGVLEQYAWQGVSASSAETHPVGEKRPNAWGLYDMHGNVWECCRDWFDENYYSQSPTDDPTGPANGTAHVIRGGCCYDPAFRCRSAHRAGEFGPGYPSDVLGFRVAFIPGDK